MATCLTPEMSDPSCDQFFENPNLLHTPDHNLGSENPYPNPKSQSLINTTAIRIFFTKMNCVHFRSVP